MENTDKLAVLIDADNAQPSIVDSLLGEEHHYRGFDFTTSSGEGCETIIIIPVTKCSLSISTRTTGEKIDRFPVSLETETEM